ncbi:DUF4169 family protein [Aureimonas psammosilenae]|uniref:DUF4169 family protein n=1 Tax=Aureimonas psammosilenae TaxID=2495496 RepID=UPI001261260B|nr:DUF4169 family protein [Aureimonas psammosilenae]
MGEVVNLRLARKRAERDRKSAEADANRAVFGRSKSAKESVIREQERAAAHLDGHRLVSADDSSSQHNEAERPSDR